MTAENLPMMSRDSLIQELEQLRSSRLICYCTGDRLGQDTQIGVKGVHKTYQWGGGIVYHRRDDRGPYGRWSGDRLGAR